jgi:GTPase
MMPFTGRSLPSSRLVDTRGVAKHFNPNANATPSHFWLGGHRGTLAASANPRKAAAENAYPPSSSSASQQGAFLSALEKIELEAGAEVIDSGNEVVLQDGLHFDNNDDGIGGNTTKKRSSSSNAHPTTSDDTSTALAAEDEEQLVSELLAAAGFSDQGLPLYHVEEDVQQQNDDGVVSTNAGTTKRRSKRGQNTQRNAVPEKESTIPDELLPRVAIIGRPNVGKSALFNRLVGRQVAIVYDYPGVTRDRLYTRASWGGRDFMLVDTGGLMSDAAALPKEQQMLAMKSLSGDGLPAAIERQAAAAVEEADALILVVDGQTGSNAADEEVLMWLRREHPGKPIALAVNKCENAAKADEMAAEFWETGLTPIALSAISGSGSGELLDAVVSSLPPSTNMKDTEYGKTGDVTVRLAIVGRPNVGKSSLLNALVGEERSIVSAMAGTTRDAVDTDVSLPDGRNFKLVDTAGVRRRASVAATKDGAEPLSVERAFRAVRAAEVVVLVIDATEGITQQDFRLAEYIAAEGRACVIAVNKWDAIAGKTATTLAEYEANVRAELRPVEWANIVFTSAKTGQRVARVLDAATAAAEEHRRRITTATMNLVLQDATGWRQPPSSGSGKRGRIYYCTQAGIKPPSFVMFCNDPKLFPEDYHKYMERQFRENVGFMGTPLRIFWRGKSSGNAD